MLPNVPNLGNSVAVWTGTMSGLSVSHSLCLVWTAGMMDGTEQIIRFLQVPERENDGWKQETGQVYALTERKNDDWT